MTANELIERSLRVLGPMTEEQRLTTRSGLLTLIPDALQKLAVLALPNNLLRKTFTVTAVNGEASLSVPLSAVEPLLLDGLKRASVFIDGFTHAAQYKADRSSLSYQSSSQFAEWTLENQTLVIKDGIGLDNYDGDVILRNAPFIPTLANVPVSLEPIMVEVLAGYYGKPTEVAEPQRRRTG